MNLEVDGIIGCVIVAIMGALFVTGCNHGENVRASKDQVAVTKQIAANTQKAAADLAAAQKVADDYKAQLLSITAADAARPVGVVQLCDAPSDSTVSQAGTHSSDTLSSPAAASIVLPVSTGDSAVRTGQHPDIGSMLNALAERADQVNLQAQALQEITQHDRTK